MGGAARTSIRRTGVTAILAGLLCAFALLTPTSSRAGTGPLHTGIHVVKVVATTASYPHAPALRLDEPRLLSAVDRPGYVPTFTTVTATSSTITSLATGGSPRMRGPPADRCH